MIFYFLVNRLEKFGNANIISKGKIVDSFAAVVAQFTVIFTEICIRKTKDARLCPILNTQF